MLDQYLKQKSSNQVQNNLRVQTLCILQTFGRIICVLPSIARVTLAGTIPSHAPTSCPQLIFALVEIKSLETLKGCSYR